MTKAPCGGPLAWRGCYSGQYDLWTADSYSHPAKMAPGLAFRILAHLEELGLLQPGGTVLDPMCGTGTSLLAAAIRGHRAVGVELEEKFVSMARANAERIGLKGFGAPIEVIQGDARRLSELLAEKGMVSMVSPPWLDTKQEARKPDDKLLWGNKRYGHQDNRTESYTDYGSAPGQIGNLPDVGIVSPPYEGNESTHIRGRDKDIARMKTKGMVVNPDSHSSAVMEFNYGQEHGQIGQEKGETYLSAMRQVYAEAFKCCPVLVVVVKDPTRAGKLRLLGRDTWFLMEQAGYHIVDYHQAILFEEQEQGHLFAGSVKQPKGRLGFFKRLAYKKGSPVSNFEHVLIGVKKEVVV